MADVRIGTSGWHYAGWAGRFYPEGTAKSRLLETYAAHFDTVEINASFYRLPTEKAVAGWADQVPADFLFAWKASRYITHVKRLLDPKDSIALVMERMQPLGRKFGPVLWQLPPQMAPDHERLARFLAALPAKRLHAIEFRNPGWYAPATMRLLRDSDVALCISDHAAAPSPPEVTARHVYLRLHGPGGR